MPILQPKAEYIKTVECDPLDIRNEKEEVLLEGHFDQINIANFWDSHGRNIPFPGYKGQKTARIRNCNIKIIKKTFDIYWEHSDMSSHEDWGLFVNGEKIPGSVIGYSGSVENLRIKLCVGAG